MPHFSLRQQAGFTLIEITIVAGLTTMLVLAGISLLLSSIVSSGRSNTVQFVKENGDYALGQIEFLLRNATEIQSTCSTGMNQITIRNIDNNLTTISRIQDNSIDKIASNSAFLTSNAVQLVNGPTFDCYESSDGLIQTVTVNFSLQRGTQGVDRSSDVQIQDFQTTVTLRNF